MIDVQSESRLSCRSVVETALGRFALAATERGLCSLAPVGDRDEPHGGDAAHPHLAAAAAWLRAYAAGDPAPFAGALDLAGSDFQRRVWQRLLAIPFGAQATYGAIAVELGIPGEARAVGAAVAANAVAILVPCHRVVGAGGALRGYAWGLDLKRRLLAHETAHAPALHGGPSAR